MGNATRTGTMTREQWDTLSADQRYAEYLSAERRGDDWRRASEANARELETLRERTLS